jgi:hypothetical protein
MANPVGGIVGGAINSLKSTDAGRAQLADMLGKAGAISPALAKDLGSSTVSTFDLSAAEGIARKLKGTPMGGVAQALVEGLNLKNDQQSLWQKAGAFAMDAYGPSGRENTRQVMENIR